ncbi:hypothetical protein Hanom_Chr07g00603791 [Helianthus anomalus]
MTNQTSQWNGMIHFIPLSIPLPRPFHSLIYSITPYQTDPKSVTHTINTIYILYNIDYKTSKYEITTVQVLHIPLTLSTYYLTTQMKV